MRYDVAIRQIRKEIPSAEWILALLEALAQKAPSGHLIIGGYAAAWTAPRQKTVHQMQADIDYIAAMCGIDLEG